MLRLSLQCSGLLFARSFMSCTIYTDHIPNISSGLEGSLVNRCLPYRPEDLALSPHVKNPSYSGCMLVFTGGEAETQSSGLCWLVSLHGKSQTKETPCLKKQGGWHLRNNT